MVKREVYSKPFSSCLCGDASSLSLTPLNGNSWPCSLVVVSILRGVSELAVPQSWYHFPADPMSLVSCLPGAVPTSLQEGN